MIVVEIKCPIAMIFRDAKLFQIYEVRRRFDDVDLLYGAPKYCRRKKPAPFEMIMDWEFVGPVGVNNPPAQFVHPAEDSG